MSLWNTNREIRVVFLVDFFVFLWSFFSTSSYYCNCLRKMYSVFNLLQKYFLINSFLFFSFWVSLRSELGQGRERSERREKQKLGGEIWAWADEWKLGSISKQQLRTPCRIFFDMPEKRVISWYLIIIFIYKYILLINKQVNELGVLIMTDFG